MSDRVSPPELKARWRREAMAAIGRRLRLFYVAEARRTLPDRLQQLLSALDQSERKHFATRTGHTPEGRGVGGGRVTTDRARQALSKVRTGNGHSTTLSQ
jgi:Anti-sigma factor NepR